MRILLTGSKGQVGLCFKDRLPENWELIASDSKTLDITDAHNVMNMVNTFEPDVIVNTAGYTAVDKAETEPERAFAINATGTLNLALAAKVSGARFIHISTDQVFDGLANAPIDENSAPNPLNTYARSKVAGELLALNAHVDTLIFRSSWIFSEYGRNFVKSILQQAAGQTELPVTDKQISCPTYAGDLAQAIIDIAQTAQSPRGIVHFTGSRQSTSVEFAQKIVQTAAQQDSRFAHVVIKPVATHDTTARLRYTVLNSQAIRPLLPEHFGETSLKTVVDKILAA